MPQQGPPGAGVDFDAIRLVLFDLDGTLVDSVPDLEWCGNRVREELGLPPHPADAARAWVGNGIERFVKRVLTGEMMAEPQAELLERGLERFRQLYAEHVSDRSLPYPGAIEALEGLLQRDLHLGCVTNKAERYTLSLLAALKLDGYFELVVSGDTTPRIKPDPMPLQHAAGHFGLAPGQCLMVGDSSNDVAAARAAGFHIACVPYGYNHGVDIQESRPDLVVENLRDLLAYFNKGETRCT